MKSKVGLYLVIASIALWWVCTWLMSGDSVLFTAKNQDNSDVYSVSDVLGQSDNSFKKATEKIPFVFPKDHGPHPDYRTEWWYITGNLSAPSGQLFGFQFTLFRIALAPVQAKELVLEDSSEKGFRSSQLYLGHFAVTDQANNQYYFFERQNRGAMKLAGVDIQPFHAFIDHWSLLSTDDNALLPLTLKLSDADVQNTVALTLNLDSQKPLVLQGDQGFSLKNQQANHASYYYSYTRLTTQGTLSINDQVYEVSGQAWLDREWSSSVLTPQQIGWDWFALQLEDGRDIMVAQIRSKQGMKDYFAFASITDQTGQVVSLTQDQLSITPKDYWQTYPISWQINIPHYQLSLLVEPLIENQEVNGLFRYWEGAIKISGSHAGVGYLEMTGYREQ